MGEEKNLVRLAQALLMRGGALQSTTEGEAIDLSLIREVLERRIADEAAHSDLLSDSLTAKVAAAEAMAAAQRAIQKEANLTDLEYASLQAIIEVTGRPAMRYDDGRVRMPPEVGDNERWRVVVAVARSRINQNSAKVGRISTDDGVWGTGWRIGKATIVTNRHVLAEIVEDRNVPIAEWRIRDAGHPLIDFSATDAASAARRFPVESIEYCAEDGDIDLAILRVTANTGLPSALKVEWDQQTLGSSENGNFRGAEIYVVGHPSRQFGSELVSAVFGVADGLKRWSPGYVTQVEADTPRFAHDCSTLGGNSGSCVLTVAGHAVVGLHFGGLGVDRVTGRGTANVAVAFAKLGTHKAVSLLSQMEQSAHG